MELLFMKFFNFSNFKSIKELKTLKKKSRLTIGIGLPVCNEAKTLNKTIGIIKSCGSLIDELIVFDSGSTDRSMKICKDLGVKFISDRQSSKDLNMPLARGKGWNLWTSLFYLNTDLIFWIDSDIKNFHKRFILGLVGPFLKDPKMKFIKGYYRRPKNDARVTEIMARPLIGLFFQEMFDFIQPLSGEYGGRKEFLEGINFYSGYSVEMAILIQAINKLKSPQIGQVYLGNRVHELQDVASLGRMGASILYTVIKLAKDMGKISLTKKLGESIWQFIAKDRGVFELVEYNIKDVMLPSIKTNPFYKKKFLLR